jgi:hypothetical protein
MYPAQLSETIAGAIIRLEADLEQAMPLVADQLKAWLADLAGGNRPQTYFEHPLAFPSLLLPWWLDSCLRDAPDETLQADLAYSTINGYLYIRLIDNVMDGHATVETQLLPALSFFHTQFQGVYGHYFTTDHPFWQLFQTVWYRSAEAAMHEAQLASIDAARFRQVSAQKVCAAKIPLAAVSHVHNRPDLIQPWSRLVDLLGSWHQMHNDLFGWAKDASLGTTTYFLSEAERQRRPDESLAGWVAREGFAWGISTLAGMMAAVEAAAQSLNCPELLDYLQTRRQLLAEQRRQAEKGLAALAKLADAID